MKLDDPRLSKTIKINELLYPNIYIAVVEKFLNQGADVREIKATILDRDGVLDTYSKELESLPTEIREEYREGFNKLQTGLMELFEKYESQR